MAIVLSNVVSIFGAKPLDEPTIIYYKLDLREQKPVTIEAMYKYVMKIHFKCRLQKIWRYQSKKNNR